MNKTGSISLAPRVVAAAVGLLLAVQAQATVFDLSGVMDVFQATTNPGNAGTGTGTISGVYDDTTQLLGYTITWQDLLGPVTNMHFHLGAPGVPGGVELAVPGPWSSPQSATGVLVDVAKEPNLLAGNWYVNVHTTAFGGGEIRGQVIVSQVAVAEPATLAVLGLGLLGLTYRRAGRAR